MHVSSATAASNPSAEATHAALSYWREDIDDTALTGNEGADADVTRLVATDEEILLEEEEELGISPRQELLETFKLLLAGGIAGGVSKTATAPLARLTILYQVQGLHANPLHRPLYKPPSIGISEALRAIVQREGLRSLWRGNGVTIVHRFPYSATNFWVYETVNELWKEHLPAQGPLSAGDVTRRLVAGGVAGLTACTMAYPLDLVRTLLAAQTAKKYYRGIGHALASIVREHGPLGLYRGLGATLLQVGPSLSINYAAYETTRSLWLSRTKEQNPSVVVSLACGSLAGLVSSTMTFPLDLVRRRMQLQGQAGTTMRYHSLGGAFHSIISTEGWRGLYSGILPEYYKVIPGVAIAFCTYEVMKRALGVQRNATQR